MIHPDLRTRVLERILVKGPDDCWLWIGGKTGKGQGVFNFKDKTSYSSRLAFEIFTGIEPGDLLVLHSCDNPECCNPNHLFLGDQTDNQQDCKAKGRRAEQNGNNNGVTNGRSIFTEDEVRDIRTKNFMGIPCKELALEYKCSLSAISRICTTRTYKDVR